MNILKINNDSGTYYFTRDKEFDVLQIIQQFTTIMGVSVTIVDGFFKTDRSELFFSYLEEYEHFKPMRIKKLQVITMRKT
jgi:hypothetical protein